MDYIDYFTGEAMRLQTGLLKKRYSVRSKTAQVLAYNGNGYKNTRWFEIYDGDTKVFSSSYESEIQKWLAAH